MPTHPRRLLLVAVVAMACAVAGPAPCGGAEPSTTSTTVGPTTSSTVPSTSTSRPLPSTTAPTSTTTSSIPPTTIDVPSTTEAPPVPKGPQVSEDQQSENPELGELPPDQLDLIGRFLEVRQQARELGDRIAALNLGMGDVQNQVVAARMNLTAAQQRLDETEQRRSDAEAELGRQRRMLREHAVAAYIGGGTGSSAVLGLFRAGSFDQLGTSVTYAGAVVDDERSIVARTTELRDRAETLARRADDDRRAAQQAQDEITARQRVLEQRRDELASAEGALLANEQAKASLLSEAARRRLDVEASLANQAKLSDGITQTLAARQAGQSPPLIIDALFGPPLPVPMKLSQRFGAHYDPLFGLVRGHPGIDLPKPTGTPILAPADGVVVAAGWIDGYGNCTIIDHGNALATLYGHQSAIIVKDGDRVVRGSVIGFVGSTGYSTGPHLHWEVRVRGVPADPLPYLLVPPS